jgi:hypothetical protein
LQRDGHFSATCKQRLFQQPARRIADEVVEGRLNRLEKGDVSMLPSSIEHVGCLREVDEHVIDILSPLQEDFWNRYLKIIQEG